MRDSGAVVLEVSVGQVGTGEGGIEIRYVCMSVCFIVGLICLCLKLDRQGTSAFVYECSFVCIERSSPAPWYQLVEVEVSVYRTRSTDCRT